MLRKILTYKLKCVFVLAIVIFISTLQYHFLMKNLLHSFFEMPNHNEYGHQKLSFMHHSNPNNKHFLVFIIPSHPKNTRRRNVIRSTWMQFTRWNVLNNLDEDRYKELKFIFIFGKMESNQTYSAEFTRELSENNDMLIDENIAEGSNSLRPKVLLGMRYTYSNFDFDYLIKTDDDVLVNLPLLLQDLMANPRQPVYWGRCLGLVGREPQRWRYCSGGGYILSRDLVQDILALPQRVFQPRIVAEDVAIGWFVWNVNNSSLSSDHIRAEHKTQALLLDKYKCGALRYWFYHGYKYEPANRMLKDFESVFMESRVLMC